MFRAKVLDWGVFSPKFVPSYVVDWLGFKGI